MKTRLNPFRARRHQAALGLTLAAINLIFLTTRGMAQYTITSGNSSATVNLGSGSGLLGMNSWNVDGANQLAQQWFWYSVNGGPVEAINEIGGLVPSLSSDGTTLTATYENSTMAVEVQYSLSGTGTAAADLTATAYVFNLTAAALNINFYQYGNFDLLNQANTLDVYGDTQDGYSTVIQTTTGGGSGIQETINQPYANYAAADSPGNVMADIVSGAALNGPYSASGSVAWAFEWSSSVAPSAGDANNAWNVLQDQDMSISQVPEPASLSWLAMGSGVIVFARRFWKRKV
jgi:hypothetical protein